MKTTRNFLMSASIILAMLISSCSKDEVAPPEASSMAIVSGGSQAAIASTALADPIEVIVKDQDGNAFKGATVKFSVAEGAVSSATTTTDAGGKATVSWTLGATVGTQTLTVTAFKADGTTALTGSPISVTATGDAVPLVATSLELDSGDGQSGVIETTLENPVVVIVKDQNGDPISGVPVSFATVDPVSSDSENSDASGEVSISWMLGTTVGTQTLTITAFEADGTTPLSGSPISVTATGESVPLVATSLELVSGDGQTATKESSLPAPIEVMVKDQNGDAFPGATVNFSVAEGTVNVAAITTNAAGIAEVNWTLGSTIGTQTLTVTSFKADGTTPLAASPISVSANATEATALAIGDFWEGGVVFWLDGSGGGLVVSVVNQSLSAPFGCHDELDGADGKAIGTGAQNTIDIEAGCTTEGTAADICANLTLNGYDDWFLPSINELAEIYANKEAINSTAASYSGTHLGPYIYGSSTEVYGTFTLNFYFNIGSSGQSHKYSGDRVRAVRAF